MAGSLGLGIGFEEHHVEDIQMMEGWQANICSEGTYDPDCDCCCEVYPPESGSFTWNMAYWTMAWAVDASGNLYPQSVVTISSDGYWVVDVLNHLTLVSVSMCEPLTDDTYAVISYCDCP